MRRSVVSPICNSEQAYTDSTAQPFTTYSYQVEAIDAAGNGSGLSSPAMVTTPGPPPSFNFNPVADSYVDGGTAGTNFGGSTSTRVDGSPIRLAYLRFDVAGVSGAVTSAPLRVYSNSSHSAGYEVQQVSDNGWGELSITYSNAPSFGPVLGASGPTTAGTYIDIDVTGHVIANRTYSFALTPLNNTNQRLSSRESANPPELTVMTGR